MRQALYDFDADPATCSVITFQEGLGTITLVDDLPSVDPEESASLSISGNGPTDTVIDAAGNAAFDLNAGPDINLQVSLAGLTVRNAYSTGNSGAAVSAYGTNNAILEVQISTVTFSDNYSYYAGGAVYMSGRGDSSLSIADSDFERNGAQYAGGAVMSDRPLTITGSTFSGNYVTDADSSDYPEGGGAVAVYNGASLDVTDSTFSNNTSYKYGGALWVDGDVTVANSSFTGNEAQEEHGGAILSEDYALTITESSFANNTAPNGSGGAVRVKGNAADVVITATTFASNQASARGGALNSNSPVTVTNSTFTGNTAGGGGGGLYLGDGGTVDFSTVVGNTGSPVGGIYGGGSLTITNSIVSGNSVDDVGVDGELTIYDSFLTSADSFSASTEPVTARLLFGDPLLGSLGDNGGPTLTMLPGAGSPVIGMADPDGAPSTDQRGYARVVDGKADMGSVQTTAVAPVPDLSQVPPSWHQASGRRGPEVPCPDGTAPSWDIWPNDGTGGWTCEWTTWWDVTKGTSGGWVTSPGYRATGKARHVFRYHAAG